MINTIGKINSKNHIDTGCKRAIAYYRVSSTSQKENTSLENQKQQIRDYAFRNKIEIVAEFRDVASGGTVNRDGFKEAMNFIQNNPVDIFMVWKYDRAHRNLKETLIFVDELNKIGADYISVHQNIDTTTPQGRLFFQMVCSINEFEKEVIRERCREGRIAKISKGENPGGRIPVGYDKNWQIVEEEAGIVKDIFNAYLRVESLNKLKDYCRENSYNEQLNISMSKMTLSKILRNRAYLGEFTYDGTVEQHQVLWKEHHEGIIAGNIFGKVQKMLKRNRRR